MSRDSHRDEDIARLRVDSLTRMIGEEPNPTELVRYYTDRAACFETLRDYGKAIDDYTTALELVEEDPHFVHIKSMLALDLLAQDQKETALFVALDAVEHDAESAEARHIFGLVCAHCGFLNSAIASLQRAVALRPDCSEAVLKLGECLREKGLMEDSIETLSAYVAQNRDDPRGLYELAWSTQCSPVIQDGIERAIQLYELALIKNPPSRLRALIQKRLESLNNGE